MTAHPVDIHVGKRIRMRRKILGLSQDDLGKAVGVTFQQVQKYERGTNRVGSSRLYELSKVLGVAVGFFFEHFSSETPENMSGLAALGFSEGSIGFEGNAIDNKETMTLVQAYYRIQDPTVRQKMLGLIKALRPANEEVEAATL
jgi:transcriptional regulator with XRE-family HTH domain